MSKSTYPAYNPLAMASQEFANNYGKRCFQINRKERIKECESNRDRILKETKK